jgi:hypothetical protein
MSIFQVSRSVDPCHAIEERHGEWRREGHCSRDGSMRVTVVYFFFFSYSSVAWCPHVPRRPRLGSAVLSYSSLPRWIPVRFTFSVLFFYFCMHPLSHGDPQRTHSTSPFLAVAAIVSRGKKSPPNWLSVFSLIPNLGQG